MRAPCCYQSISNISTSFLSQNQETMQGPNANTSKNTMAFKQYFLKNLFLSLRARTEACSFHAMSLRERKRAVKSSADVAMAAARGAGARWPKAILAAPSSSSPSCKVRSRCRRVVRRWRCHKKRRGDADAFGSATSSDIARRLVKRRTMALRKVIPGGDAAMDEASLLREAMDYVVHLRAQVDVLRRVSEAVQRSSRLRGSCSVCAVKEEEPSSMKECGELVIDGSEEEDRVHAFGKETMADI
ncbi:transcription factor IBH1-like 1 [Phragmites australis]|uniref:transcription factor IBH1-like 1 n=1 Tax=Phragmites australis TaxID=29695 RepID=UPI002D76B045|nr:transcription factor IBH1-like 1 [Phragmites australis]